MSVVWSRIVRPEGSTILRDDRLFATASVSNTLWEISLEDGSLDSTAVIFEDYDPPVLPPTDHEAWRNGRSMMAWVATTC